MYLKHNNQSDSDNLIPGIFQSMLLGSYSTFYSVFPGYLASLNNILMRFQPIIPIFR